MTSIRVRLATASAALAAVLHATMPPGRGAPPRLYAVRVVPAEPRTPIYLSRYPTRRAEPSPW